MFLRSFCFLIIVSITLFGNCHLEPNQTNGTQTRPFQTFVNEILNLKIGTNKILLYLNLRNFVKNNNGSDSHTDELKVEQSLEHEIVRELQDLFRKTFTGERSSNASQQLKAIQWDLVADVDLHNSKDNHFLFIQNIMNQTLSDNYRNVNISLLLDRVEAIPVSTESSKISKVLIYGALHHAIHAADKEEQQYAFQLAYNIHSHYHDVKHQVKHDYFDQYLKRLLNGFHGCVQKIVNQPNATSGHLVKNYKYSEYLYVTTEHFPQPINAWRTTPLDLNKRTYRPVFTWVPKDMGPRGRWLLIHKNGHFWIKNGFYSDRYLDTSHQTTAHAPVVSELRTNIAVRIIPSLTDRESCYIENLESHRSLYAGNENEKEDANRRTIFTNGQHLAVNNASLWLFT